VLIKLNFIQFLEKYFFIY